MTAIADYQTLLSRASEIREGDFLDSISATMLVGPRGGKYRYDGLNVGSRVTAVAWVYRDGSGHAVELPLEDTAGGWRPERLVGFKISTVRRSFTLPGNLADLTAAVVRRES